jgi:acyl-CoA thioester hydrolase
VKELLTYRGSVYPWQCDQMGHMNVMFYVGKFDEATWQLFAALGLTPTYFRETQSGVVALEQHLTYKKELLSGAVIEIRSRIISLTEKVIVFLHEMHDAETGVVAATCKLTVAHIDRRIRKSSHFPASFRDEVGQFLEAADGRSV